jgi:hypothetical protein
MILHEKEERVVAAAHSLADYIRLALRMEKRKAIRSWAGSRCADQIKK